jgi:membrane-bound lytic murein transglycosylase D
VPSDKVVLKLKRTLHLRTLAVATKSTVRELKRLNPAIRRYLLPRGTHTIRVPKGEGAGLKARLSGLNTKRKAPKEIWVVKSGETLSSIARQNGVKLNSLKRANQIKGSLVRPGQKLVIPRH